MTTTFEKLDSVGLKERFVQEIQRKIFAGELLPGEQLPPERELAAQMGISRSLVNVGILDLESKGFVDVVPRTGTFVIDYRENPTPDTLAALMHYDSEPLDYALFQNFCEYVSVILHSTLQAIFHVSICCSRSKQYSMGKSHWAAFAIDIPF